MIGVKAFSGTQEQLISCGRVCIKLLQFGRGRVLPGVTCIERTVDIRQRIPFGASQIRGILKPKYNTGNGI